MTLYVVLKDMERMEHDSSVKCMNEGNLDAYLWHDGCAAGIRSALNQLTVETAGMEASK